MRKRAVVPGFMVAVIGLALSGVARAADPVDAQATKDVFLKTDPGLQKFFDQAVGYAVFPTIGKGGVGIGGAHGDGILFDKTHQPVATVSMTQVTVGLQLGGQKFSEIIFFENEKVFRDFKASNFTLTAAASAVALANGASASAKFEKGVAIFTATKGGLMFEASVGGQKFKVKPMK
jgi:lipid-binding SYLF domain-containing protein